MAKKVFSNQEATQARQIQVTPVQKATPARQVQVTPAQAATPARPAQAAAEMAKQEGPEARQKLFVSFTKSNYDFLTVLAQAYGTNKTALVNRIIAEYREAHENDAIYQDTLAFIDKVAAQRAAAGYGDLE